MRARRILISITQHPGCPVVTVHGTLRLDSVPAITVAVTRLLHERGMAALDLSALRLEWNPGVEIFPRLLQAMGGWPTTRLVLFGADPDMTAAMRRCRVPRHVPLVADLDTALRRIYDRPRWKLRQHPLPAESGAPRAAREIMREACTDWHIDHVAIDAALVANELVTNAVQHAGTRSVLTTEWDVRGLHVGVRDFRPAAVPPPQPVGPRPTQWYGLQVVTQLAGCWAVNHHTDGKTISAVIKVDNRRATAA